MDSPRKSSVLVADAEPLARRGLVQVINEHAQVKVCAEADNIGAARDLCARYRPDVLVLDPAQGDGFSFLKDLPRSSEQTRVVVLTALDDAASVQRTLQLGALGYLSRHDPISAVLSTILGVLAGERHLGPRVQRVLLGEIARGTMQMERGELARLSHRERDVFSRIGAGYATRLIAEDLHMSVKTVETHRQRIKDKLGLSSGAELLQRAVLLNGSVINGA